MEFNGICSNGEKTTPSAIYAFYQLTIVLVGDADAAATYMVSIVIGWEYVTGASIV